MATVDTVGVKYEADLKSLVSAQEKLIAENKAIAAGAEKIGKEYTDSTKAASKGVDNLTKKTGELKKEGEGLGGAMKKVGAAMVAAFAVEKIAAFAKQVLDVSANFQKMNAVLTNTLGSKGAATAAMKEIVDFASKTPFAVEELTASFVKLANQGFIPTQDEMRKLGDLASSQGKSFDMLTEAIIDAQTGEFERLKEFGIRASKEGDNVKFSFKGVETQTKFNSEAMREYILSLGDLEGVSGGMAAISETLGGKFSNLGDATMALEKEIGDALNPIMIDLIDLVLEVMENMDILSSPLEEVSGLFTEMFDSLSSLLGALTDVSGKGTETSDVMDVLAGAFRFTLIPLKVLMTTLTLAADTWRLLVNEAKKAANFFGAEFEIDPDINADKLVEDIKNIGQAFSLVRQESAGGIVAEGFFANQVALNEARIKNAQKKGQEDSQKEIDRKKKEADKLHQDLLKKEFDAQAIRISLMKDGWEKQLLALHLAFEKEKNQYRDNKKALLLIEEKFQKDLQDLTKGATIKREQSVEKTTEKIKTKREKQIEEDNKLVQAGFENLKKKREDEKKRENAITEEKKKATDDRLAIEESSFAAISAIGNALIQDEMKRAQFQKAVSLFQIGVATAEAIAKGVASAQSVPFPGNLIAVAATIATVFANIATAKAILSSAPTPAFKEGVIDLQGPGTGTSDSIRARLSKGESVMTNRETAAYKDELMAIRKGQFEDMILSKYVLPALREDRKQRDTGSNMAASLMLQSAFDDSGIIRSIDKQQPATAKDIKKLGKEITKGYEKAAYKQSKLWRNG